MGKSLLEQHAYAQGFYMGKQTALSDLIIKTFRYRQDHPKADTVPFAALTEWHRGFRKEKLLNNVKQNDMGKWDEVDQLVEGNGGSDFFRFQDGENQIRIVTEYEAVRKHWLGNQGILCVSGCSLCSNGEMPKTKFLFYVIDRKDKSLKIAEFGPTIVKALRALQKGSHYSFDSIPGYDILITKHGSGLDTEYTVVPLPPTELTIEEKKKIEEAKPLSEVIENISKKATETNEESR